MISSEGKIAEQWWTGLISQNGYLHVVPINWQYNPAVGLTLFWENVIREYYGKS